MSEMSRNARRAMRAKIHRITQATTGKVDASDYGPEEVLDAGVKTGLRPVSRRAYKKGGKVVASTGKDAVKHAGKKPRAGGKPLTIDALVNRDVKDANEAREGKKHVGGLKRGGRAKKAGGGTSDTPPKPQDTPPKPQDTPPNPQDMLQTMIQSMSNLYGVKKAAGGKTKKAGGGPLSAMGGDLYGMKNNPNPNRATALKKGGAAKRKHRADGGYNLDQDLDDTVGRQDFNRDFDTTFAKKNAPLLKSQGPYKSRPPRSMDDSGEPDMGREPTDADIAKMNQRPNRYYKYGNRASGGKVWEGSKKDEAQDKKLAKKHGMSMKKWEASALDKKHDKQHSTKGLKRGGMTSLDGEYQTQEKVSGRIAKRDGGSLAGLEMNTGGRAKKAGKTNINIIIGTGQKPPMGLAPGMPQPPAGGIPVPVPPPGAGAPPMAAGAPPAMPVPMPAPAAGAGGPPPMGRKRGGRTYRSYKDMDAGAGSGLGRLEKTEIQKHKK